MVNDANTYHVSIGESENWDKIVAVDRKIIETVFRLSQPIKNSNLISEKSKVKILHDIFNEKIA